MRSSEVTASAAVLHGHPACPLRGIDESTLGLILRFEHSPITPPWCRGQVAAIDYIAITDGRPTSIVTILDAYMERSTPIVVVAVAASPGGATIIACTLLCVQRCCTTTIAVGLEPIDLNTPRLYTSTITIILFNIALGTNAWRDCVDVSVHARPHTREVDVKFHGTSQQVESRLCSNTTVTGHAPTSILQLR